MSSAFNMFFKSAVSYNGIPFEVKRREPNAETLEAFAEDEEMKRNRTGIVMVSSWRLSLSHFTILFNH